MPSYRSLLGSAFPDKRSSIFSALSALESIPGLVAPVLFTQLYSRTVGEFSGCAYLAMGLAGAAALALLLAFAAVDRVVEIGDEDGHEDGSSSSSSEGHRDGGRASASSTAREELPLVVSS